MCHPHIEGKHGYNFDSLTHTELERRRLKSDQQGLTLMEQRAREIAMRQRSRTCVGCEGTGGGVRVRTHGVEGGRRGTSPGAKCWVAKMV